MTENFQASPEFDLELHATSKEIRSEIDWRVTGCGTPHAEFRQAAARILGSPFFALAVFPEPLGRRSWKSSGSAVSSWAKDLVTLRLRPNKFLQQKARAVQAARRDAQPQGAAQLGRAPRAVPGAGGSGRASLRTKPWSLARGRSPGRNTSSAPVRTLTRSQCRTPEPACPTARWAVGRRRAFWGSQGWSGRQEEAWGVAQGR